LNHDFSRLNHGGDVVALLQAKLFGTSFCNDLFDDMVANLDCDERGDGPHHDLCDFSLEMISGA
jgi:hypothetical protein